MELVPRISNVADALGSPVEDSTVSPGTCPCSAWSKAAVGVLSIFSDFTLDTEPVIVPFFLTPYATTTVSSSSWESEAMTTS